MAEKEIRHCQIDQSLIDYAVYLKDPAIVNVHADMTIYLETNPCNCEARCVCDD